MRYLVETVFKNAPTPDALALIPAEVAHGKELDAQGIRLMLYIAADQSKAWQVFRSNSIEEVQATVASFPLHSYVNTTITPLANDDQSGSEHQR